MVRVYLPTTAWDCKHIVIGQSGDGSIGIRLLCVYYPELDEDKDTLSENVFIMTQRRQAEL